MTSKFREQDYRILNSLKDVLDLPMAHTQTVTLLADLLRKECGSGKKILVRKKGDKVTIELKLLEQ